MIAVKNLLNQSNDKERKILWIPKEIVKSPREEPLLKVEGFSPNKISTDSLISFLRSIFKKYNSGEYHVNLLYGRSGIYVCFGM